MKPFAAVFPGQGSQHSGMGKALHDVFPEARSAFDEADAALEVPLSRVCFAGTDEELSRTETTQPALLAASVAALRALESRGARPAWVAGHSLGEYSAHVAAGTLAFADALRIVRLRGRFMQEAVPIGEGAMAAILGLDRDAVEDACRRAGEGRVVAPANFNGPGQIVIAGHADAVGRACEIALAAGARRAVSLPVSAPFHCSLMTPAALRLRDVLDEASFGAPRVPVFTNVDAAPVRTAEEARSALVRQVASPVRWHEEVESMAAAGIGVFVEVGPGRILAGLVKRIAKGATVLTVSDPEGLDAAISQLAGVTA